MTLWRDLGLWFWRLLPANPILVRVVTAGGKRVRHQIARFIYLVILFVVMVLFGSSFLGSGNSSLVELAKNSTQVFMYVSFVQLFLMSFIAPVFTAGAITQEKDANTYNILLTTPLSNAQIVLGSLMSRLYFVWVLLLSGLPIFCIMMIYGGVTTKEVFESFGLAACTGLVTGALAILISVLKVGTRRTIFSFFVGLAAYLLGIWAIAFSSFGGLSEAPAGPLFNGAKMSWLAPAHPFLALLVVTGQTPAPKPADVFHYGWPWRSLLAYPQYGYMTLTTLASVGMILLSLFFVRKGVREGESTLGAKLRAFLLRKEEGEKRRKPRHVWKNPIAWREAATRASAGGRSAMRWVFIFGGVAVGGALMIAHHSGWLGVPATVVQYWLKVLICLELGLVLLVVTSTAATTLTREKEAQTIEILLTTPLTSGDIVRGMWQGLVSFALPFIAVPTLTLLLFAIADWIQALRGSTAGPIVAPEAVLFVPLLMTAFAATAAMIGLQWSLALKKTIQAVMVSTGIVLGISGLLLGCGWGLGTTNYFVAAVMWPFTPFTAMIAQVDYMALFSRAPTPDEIAVARITRAITSVLAAGLYGALARFSLYSHIVRTFDMTVRKQST